MIEMLQQLPKFKNIIIESDATRPETGPMQFEDDWPGVFFRGDHALYYAIMLEQIKNFIPEDKWPEHAIIRNLIAELRSCSIGDGLPLKDVYHG